MPYITVESGVLSDTQKEELIKQLTEISSEIMKIPQEFFVTTIKNAGSAACVPRIYYINSCLASTKITAISYRIKEVPDKNFGIGGKTIDKVKAEYIHAHKSVLQLRS